MLTPAQRAAWIQFHRDVELDLGDTEDYAAALMACSEFEDWQGRIVGWVRNELTSQPLVSWIEDHWEIEEENE